MKLSIVITHYREPWETCIPLFSSLVLQQGLDFSEIEVIVSEDGKDGSIPKDRLAGYPFEITVVGEEINKGVSHARNLGLDRAKGDYVMFCDCDDMFHNLFGLRLVLEQIDKGIDVVSSVFIEEQRLPDGTARLLPRETDATFVHGKAFRKEFLTANGMRFRDDLTIHEDGYFVCLAMTLAETRHEIKTPFYMWRYNPDSVVRKDSDCFVLRTYDHVLNARTALIEELRAHGKKQDCADLIVKTVFDAYYELNKPDGLDEKNRSVINRMEKSFKRFYTKYRAEYHKNGIDRVGQIAAICRANAFKNGFRLEQFSIQEWLTHIVNDV